MLNYAVYQTSKADNGLLANGHLLLPGTIFDNTKLYFVPGQLLVLVTGA